MIVSLICLLHAATLGVPVTMSPEDQTRLGVEETVMTATEAPQALPAIVQVLDAGALAALDADLATALAAAGASQRDYQRTLGLARNDQSASRAAVEAARSKAEGDEARASLLRRRLALEWGPAIAAMSAQDRASLLDAIATGDAALLRADSLEAPGGLVGTVTITLPDRQTATAEPIGLTGSASTRLQTIGTLAVLRGPEALSLRSGRSLGGTIDSGESLTGILLPREAIVRLDGDAWAYVETGPDTFFRQQIVSPRIVADGWLVTTVFTPGDRVVTSGAGALLAVERADESAESE
ncbi:hypothetical protein PB2503_00345 [Parvularcula bermudensis HTCC2503]|uniref:Uncharacterized protein n=1 Tax=Parvularcula bermudensis (strain ATCC BAA-594 / HTCC2503 / KCTC 12087) TaxID=314260 RepID=E0TIH8_PARBH|nr:hypothetical protein [Parvularcula bermudensis]ADM10836.1 hypothetical protein PB2503_00345 [Parvularcula bermudensis HTCC2503]